MYFKRFFVAFSALCACSFVNVSAKECYVKQNGTGIGLSWSDAMSPETFASKLAGSAAGTVFHVAAGTYFPSPYTHSDISGSLTAFVIERGVTVIGGYPADAQDGDVSDPEHNPTIFSGDINGDDEVVIDETTANSKYGSKTRSCTYNNYSDDLPYILVVIPGVTLEVGTDGYTPTFKTFENTVVNIQGITFKGSSNTAILVYGNDLDLNIENSTFEKTNESINVSCDKEGDKQGHLTISNTVFKNCMQMDAYNDAVVIKNSKFNDCVNSGISLEDDMNIISFNSNSISLSNVEFNRNYGKISLVGSSSTSISDSKFEGNSASRCFMSTSGNNSVEYLNCYFNHNDTYNGNLIWNYISNFSNCQFLNGITSDMLVFSSKSTFNNCVFDSNSFYELNGYGSYVLKDDDTKEITDDKSCVLNKCSIVNNKAYRCFFEINHDVVLSNCLIANNTANDIIESLKCQLYNNTICGNSFSELLLFTEEDCILHGNIILSNGPSGNVLNAAIAGGSLDSEYNLTNAFSDGNNYLTPATGDIYVAPFGNTDCSNLVGVFDASEQVILKNLYDGSYDATSGKFTPTFDNSTSMPILKLKRHDIFDANGVSANLRFPMTETTVYEDHRGHSRFFYTCAGDYEVTDSIFADWIVADTSVNESDSSSVDSTVFEVETASQLVKAEDANKLVNVYSPKGVCLKKNVNREESVNGLPRGLYIVDDKKVMKW